MIKHPANHLILPAFISFMVLILAFSLLTIVARSPYTNSNLNLRYDPNYTRTEQDIVGAPVPITSGMLAVPRASNPAELGKQLYVVDGCASCHGLDGSGGILGPAIANMTVETLRSITNRGPQGMPAYAPNALSDEDLAAIAAFLSTNGK